MLFDYGEQERIQIEKKFNSLVTDMEAIKDLVRVKEVKLGSHSKSIFRARIIFENGLILSVVQGTHTYGSEHCPYELAVFRDREMVKDILQTDDTVLGYQSSTNVLGHIITIGNI